MKLPDANSVSGLLLDWDDKRLNTLPAPAQKKILTTIETNGPKEIANDRRRGRVRLGARECAVESPSQLGRRSKGQVRHRPATGQWDLAEPTIKETIARSDDLFTIGFKVENRTSREIVTRIVHRVEPKEMAPYLDLVECALLLPVRFVRVKSRLTTAPM